MTRAERRRVDRGASRDDGDRAALSLMAAVDEALRQQRHFEARGLAPGDVAGGCVAENGEKLARQLPGMDAAGRVIVVTRKAAFGPAVWFYTSREAGLEIMTRPAVAAFNGVKAGRSISAAMWGAVTYHAQAIMNARARDAAALAVMPEGGRA